MATVTSIESAGELTMSNPILANIRLDQQTNKIVLNDVLDMFNIDSGNKCRYYNRLKKNHPTLFSNEEKLRVNGKGQTHRVIDIPSTIEIIWLLPGDYAIEFRRKSANYITRLFAGDRTLIDEIEIQHERVSPETRETMLTHVERPSLPQVSVLELQNIVNRQQKDLTSKNEQLNTALLQNTDLTKKNIDLNKKNTNLIQQKEKIREAAHDWHRRCDSLLQTKLQPVDALVANLTCELTNSLNNEYEYKMDKINEMHDNNIADTNAYDRMRILELTVKKLVPNYDGDIVKIVDEALEQYKEEIKDNKEDILESYVSTIKEMEHIITTLKKNALLNCNKITELKKEMAPYQGLREIVEKLKRDLERISQDKENVEEKYKNLKRKNKDNKKSTPVATSGKKRKKTIQEIKKEHKEKLPLDRQEQIKYYDSIFGDILYSDDGITRNDGVRPKAIVKMEK